MYGSVWCVTNTSHRKLCRTQPDRHIPDTHYTPNSLCCQGLWPPQKSVQAGFGVSHKTDRLLLFKVSPPMRYSSAGWRGYGGKLLERSFPHPSRTLKQDHILYGQRKHPERVTLFGCFLLWMVEMFTSFMVYCRQ